MLDALAAVIAAVGDHTEAIIQALGLGDLRDHFEDVGHNRGILRSDGAAAVDVGLGNHQDVGGSLGSDVPEGVDGFILINLGGRDVACDDLAE